MNEFLEQFVLESRELSEQATAELLALEKAPGDRERLDGAFRAFHTLKGGAAIVDFKAMSRAVHAAEDALSAVRQGEAQISGALIGECLAIVGQVLQWLDEIDRGGELPTGADGVADALAARFAAIGEKPAEPTRARAALGGSEALTPPARRLLDEQLLLLAEAEPTGRSGRIESAGRVAANVLRHLSRDTDAARIEEIAFTVALGDPATLAEAISSVSDVTVAEPRPGTHERSDLGARTLRVDAARIEALVALTGELIVANNAIAHAAKRAVESGNSLASDLTRQQAVLERLTNRLQHAVLNLRVLPLRMVFQRFQRVVRELAVELGKPTSLVIEGEDTECDKAIVDMLFEPLLHVVRNAIDHGVEKPEGRQAAGKPPIATITLRAHRESDNVIIALSDDGSGIDVDRVRETAIQRGVVDAQALGAMSDAEAIDLIFASGFSTATVVTGLSGRGVGLDAVRRSVETIGGRVGAETQAGRGSTFRFVLPFSIMVTRIMTVTAGGQMFGIPLDNVVETVRVARERIRAVGSAAAVVLRDRMIPLLPLARTLGVSVDATDEDEAVVVVAAVGGQLGALEVDRLGERLEIILKPAEGLLSGVSGILGTTLLGNGEVLLVLNLMDLFE